MMSSIVSIPIESRTVPGVMPAAASSSSSICECVVEAGWMASDRTSPMLARWENSSRDSMKAWPAGRPPAISKVKTEPAPFGAYLRASS